MSLSRWAELRSSLGVRTAGGFVGLTSPQPHRSLTAEEMTALGMGFGAHADTGYTPRPRGIDIAGHTSLGGHPFRGAAIRDSENQGA